MRRRPIRGGPPSTAKTPHRAQGAPGEHGEGVKRLEPNGGDPRAGPEVAEAKGWRADEGPPKSGVAGATQSRGEAKWPRAPRRYLGTLPRPHPAQRGEASPTRVRLAGPTPRREPQPADPARSPRKPPGPGTRRRAPKSGCVRESVRGGRAQRQTGRPSRPDIPNRCERVTPRTPRARGANPSRSE